MYYVVINVIILPIILELYKSMKIEFRISIHSNSINLYSSVAKTEI